LETFGGSREEITIMWESGWGIAILIGASVIAIAVLILAVLWRPLRNRKREAQLVRARHDFHRQRERLEAKFLQLAGRSGKPRGLEWTNCDFEDEVVYARDRRTGDLSAFVGVTISFEAVAGGGMEDVEAVGNLRAATAVFRIDKGHWATDGRAIFNLNPTEAVRYYQDNLELIEESSHSV
jgi:hypothetical protein